MMRRDGAQGLWLAGTAIRRVAAAPVQLTAREVWRSLGHFPGEHPGAPHLATLGLPDTATLGAVTTLLATIEGITPVHLDTLGRDTDLVEGTNGTPITVTLPEAGQGAAVAIQSISWKKLRCNVEVSGAGPGLIADVRVKAADPSTSIVNEIKTLEADGQVSLLVEDADFQGQSVVLVILDESGAIRTQSITIVGE